MDLKYFSVYKEILALGRYLFKRIISKPNIFELYTYISHKDFLDLKYFSVCKEVLALGKYLFKRVIGKANIFELYT